MKTINLLILSTMFVNLYWVHATAAEPISKILKLVPEQRSTLIYLEVPQHFVGNCIENSGKGKERAFAHYYARRNHASIGAQEIIIHANGSYEPANGEKPLPDFIHEPYLIGFSRQFDCLVPILTAEQVKAIQAVGRVRQISPPIHSISQHPDFKETDLVKSKRYQDYVVKFEAKKGVIYFNRGASGGINLVLRGSSIGQIIENPGVYGLNAFYHIIKGSCGGLGLVTNIDTVEKLQSICTENDFLEHADLATKGIGLTVLEAY
jgi:hypothetical protein